MELSDDLRALMARALEDIESANLLVVAHPQLVHAVDEVLM